MMTMMIIIIMTLTTFECGPVMMLKVLTSKGVAGVDRKQRDGQGLVGREEGEGERPAVCRGVGAVGWSCWLLRWRGRGLRRSKL